MKWLARLYPPRFRQRYGPEFEALLEQVRPTPATFLDVLTRAAVARWVEAWSTSPTPLAEENITARLAAPLGEQVIRTVDTTLDREPVKRTLQDSELPVVIEAEAAGLRMAINEKVLIIKHDAARNRILVTVSEHTPEAG